MSTSNLVNISNLNVSFNKNKLFDNLMLSIKPNDFIVLKGENGIGKSTLVEYITGMRYSKAVSKDKGIVISYVPQSSAFVGTVRQMFDSLSWSFDLGNTENVIRSFSIKPLLDKQFTNISSGEKQRVLLGLSFLRKPDLIILDEFTKGLDKLARDEFIQLIKNLKKEYKIAILIVSHNKDVIKGFESSVWEIRNGRIEVSND